MLQGSIVCSATADRSLAWRWRHCQHGIAHHSICSRLVWPCISHGTYGPSNPVSHTCHVLITTRVLQLAGAFPLYFLIEELFQLMQQWPAGCCYLLGFWAWHICVSPAAYLCTGHRYGLRFSNCTGQDLWI
jgi:hypothetical protein